MEIMYKNGKKEFNKKNIPLNILLIILSEKGGCCSYAVPIHELPLVKQKEINVMDIKCKRGININQCHNRKIKS